MNRKSRGFTLVEILIVVIILGILAAIVIPQFTEASTEARKSSISSTLQTIRSQIELFKVQHNDQVPILVGSTTGTDAWAIMLKYTTQTGVDGAVAANMKDLKDTTNGFIYGPYLQTPPVNPLNGKNGVKVVITGTTIPTGAQADCGWVYMQENGTVYATDATCTVTAVSQAY